MLTEHCGQRVIPQATVANVMGLKCDVSETRTYEKLKAVSLIEGVDYFNYGARIFYTASGVLKIADRYNLPALKTYTDIYFNENFNEVSVTGLIPVEWLNQRVITSDQLAQVYQCSVTQIKQNFNNNKDNFTEGKHYYKLEGTALKDFKNRVENFYLVGKNANVLYLWTREGAVCHCKMLNTVKAWEMFNALEENYFTETKPAQMFRLSDLINEVGAVKAAILKLIDGVKDDIALAMAINTVERFYGQELSELKSLIPAASHDIVYMNATQVGKKVGWSAQKVNQVLMIAGLQNKDRVTGEWHLTEKGKQFGEYKAFENGYNKHEGYCIQWSDKLVDYLQKTDKQLTLF